MDVWLIIVIVLVVGIIATLLLAFTPLRTVLPFERHPLIYSETDIDRLVPKVDLLRLTRSSLAQQARLEQASTVDFRLAQADNLANLELYPNLKVFLRHNPAVHNAFIYRPERGMSFPPTLKSQSRLIRYQLVLDMGAEGNCQAVIGGVYHDLRAGSQILFDVDVPHILIDRGGSPLILVVDVTPEGRSAAKKIKHTLHKLLGLPSA